MNDRYLTRQQAAERAGVGIRTIDKWVRLGKLQKYRAAGGRTYIFVSQAELDQLTALTLAEPLLIA